VASLMEGFNIRLKTENRLLPLDAKCLTGLTALVAERIASNINVKRHSSIGCRALSQFIATLQPWS
jgi:hypothetical protein